MSLGHVDKIECDVLGCTVHSMVGAAGAWGEGWVLIEVDTFAAETKINSTSGERKVLCPIHSAMLNSMRWKLRE